MKSRRPTGRPTGAKTIQPETFMPLAAEVLRRWTPKSGPTQRQLCAEVGLPFWRFSRIVHWQSDTGPSGPLMESERLAVRRRQKGCGP